MINVYVTYRSLCTWSAKIMEELRGMYFSFSAAFLTKVPRYFTLYALPPAR